MARKQFSQTEVYIRSLFPVGTIVNYKGDNFCVVTCCKPSPSSGECKTDVYLELESRTSGKHRLFKISVKQTNADFLENKISYERAKEIFGNKVDLVLKTAVNSVKQSFIDDYLVYFSPKGRTEAKSLKLGWKFEFVNKAGGERSGIISLSLKQKLDIYSGTNLEEGKRNSMVNGVVVENSGVADYILLVKTNHKYSAAECLDALIPLEEYVKDKDIYFACKANNYRVAAGKWDGDRPLSVWVDWFINEEGLLDAKLNFTAPLKKRSNEVGNSLSVLLGQLGINALNFDSLKDKLAENIAIFAR